MKFWQPIVAFLVFSCSVFAEGLPDSDPKNHHNGHEFKVAFINPGHPEGDQTGSFWSKVSQFMRAAADDLNIHLDIVYAKRNHIIMKSLIREVSEMQPDYIILVNEKGVADEMLSSCMDLQIPIFMLLNDFDTHELSGLTQQQRELIIGSVKPDNFSAGRKIAEDLLTLHRQKHEAPPITLYALNGDYTTPAAQDRHAGLLSAIKNDADIEFIDSTVANWSKQEAFTKTQGILQRHNIDIIWAANDPMAFGAKQALYTTGSERPIIGGINWDMDAPEFPLDVSYGGHLTLGAKALLMLNDYRHGVLQRDDMYQVVDIFQRGSPEQIIRFNQLFVKDNLNNIDFTQFSETENSPLDFTIDNLMQSNQISF